MNNAIHRCAQIQFIEYNQNKTEYDIVELDVRLYISYFCVKSKKEVNKRFYLSGQKYRRKESVYFIVLSSEVRTRKER